MSSSETALFTATATGFYGGGRVRKGATFRAPANSKFGWAVRKGSAEAREALVAERTLLDQPARDIIAALPGLPDKELAEMVRNEQAGKTRKGVLAALGDEIANRRTRANDAVANGESGDQNPLS